MNIALPEIVACGIYNSDIAIKNTSVSKKRKTTMFEIEIPIEDGGVSYIDTSNHPIRTDTIICAKPGQLRHTRLPFKCHYVHIILAEGYLYDSLLSSPDFITTENKEKYCELFNKIRKHFDSGLSQDHLMLHSAILELIHNLLRDSESTRHQYNAKNSNRAVIENAIAYIGNNLTADLSLEAVSEYAGFSPIHFHNCFKVSTGRTLREFVEDQRIKKAMNMLITTDNTLTEIAYACGFSSQSYFSFAFKRKTKLTPREYAAKITKQYGE